MNESMMKKEKRQIQLYSNTSQVMNDAIDRIVVEIHNKKIKQGKAHKVLLTGCGPQCGNTSICIGLGISFATSKWRTLIVDCDLRKKQDFKKLNEHTEMKDIAHHLDPLIKQKVPMGVISEAGCPAVADPGAAVVEIAQKKNLKVIPLAGPSSMIMAVMCSGFNGQSFAFNGYLPVKPNERAGKLRQLENRAQNEKQTQLFIEAPYRNLKMLETILSVCRKDTLVCVAAGLTTEQEYVHTHTVAEWKEIKNVPINKVPAIFLIYR